MNVWFTLAVIGLVVWLAFEILIPFADYLATMDVDDWKKKDNDNDN